MPTTIELANLPEDSESLKALLCSVSLEQLREQQRANHLHLENLRLQKELYQLKKLYCGPRADRLQSEQELAQALLDFAQELDRKPVHPEDVPSKVEPQYELRRVKKRTGRRQIANFENLPVTTHVHELKAEERACPCCGQPRQEIGAEESWQVEYIPGRFGNSVLHENLGKCMIYAGFSSLPDLTAAVAVAVGMWKPASFAGFQAPRAGRTVVAEAQSSRPRSVISTAMPRFIGHSVENVPFARPTERK